MGSIHRLVLQHGRNGARNLVQGEERRRLVEIAAEVLEEESRAIGITYSGFCLTALPHRRLPDDRHWVRTSPRVALMVEPGRLPEDERLYGVPYGSRARLILLYLQTRAMQTGSPEVELGRSMREWMGRLGVSLGGKSYRDVRDQANRISACRLTFSWNHGGGTGFKRDGIVDGGITLHDEEDDARQGRLWVDTVHLSPTFFRALREHPVPIWEPALRYISNQSMAIDVYIWLAYRLHQLEGAARVSWPALHGQFGAGFRALHHFKPRFTEATVMACAVYPEAAVDVTDQGLTLHPSPPPVPARTLLA